MATYTIDEIIQQMDGAIEQLEKELPQISEELATNSMALIINRIQQHGLPGKKYSDNKLPKFFFFDKALNAGGRNALSKKKKGKRGQEIQDNEGISYEEWRKANGLQVAYKDLTFSGRMFQNVQIIGTVRRGNNFITILGASDAEEKKKLEWNTIREGDFFVLHEEDEKIIHDLGDQRILSIINNFIK